MILSELRTILETIPMFEGKVVYYAWAEGTVPDLPFICYLVTDTDNFVADNRVYEVIQNVDIELYTRIKDLNAENAIEETLNNNNIVWNKAETFLKDENCFMITYSITI